MRGVLFCVLMLVASLAIGQDLAIKAGDILTVTTANQTQYSGDCLVASDGAITIPIAGRLLVAGKTIPKITKEAKELIGRFVVQPSVTVNLKTEASNFVYLVSENVANGTVIWTAGMDVRQLISKHPTLGPVDQYVCRLYRKGVLEAEINLAKLLKETVNSENVKLLPGDVLAVMKTADKMVWVTGSVIKPGQVRIGSEDGASQAIALAGGRIFSPYSDSEITVTLRRGAEAMARPLSELEAEPRWKMEPGDTITVQFPLLVSVVVGGSVNRPGEVKIREGSSFAAAVETAGGTSLTGTLEGAILFRGSETTVFDARSLAQGGTDKGISVANGDFIYIPSNKREFNILGFVMKPGPHFIPDQRELRLADCLALSEGLKPNGTMRRVVILHAESSGKMVAKRYDLDKYIKDGDMAQNPKILSGDIVFFDQTSGTTITEVLRIIPSLLLLDRFF